MIVNKKDKLDKAFEDKSAKELVLAPAAALQGVSDADGDKLERSFNIETIEDMANCEWYNKALVVRRKVLGE